MGITQSHLGNVGLRNDQDETFVFLNDDIYDDAIIKPYLKVSSTANPFLPPARLIYASRSTRVLVLVMSV